MKSKYFKIYELVPKHIYYKFGESAWKFIDRDLIIAIDTLKERFPLGAIIINNYQWGGLSNWGGLRTPSSKYYSETSMHSFGKAVDCTFTKYSSDEVRKDIINNPDIYPTIKGLEIGVSWVHLDTRNADTLVLFKG